MDGTQSGDKGSSHLAPIMTQEGLCPTYANKLLVNIKNIVISFLQTVLVLVFVTY